MRWTVFCTLLAIANVSVSSGQPCANPLFANYQVIDSQNDPSTGTISVTTNTPALFPGDQHSVCKSFVGQQSCCTSDTLKIIAKANSDMQSTMAISKAFGSAILQQATANFTNLMTNTCSSPYTSGSTMCADIPTKLQVFNNAANQLLQDSFACMDALEVYNAGMRCFACSASWGSYVNTAASTVSINTNTCSNMVKVCTPMNDGLISVLRSIISILEPFSFSPSGASMIANISATPDFCGGKVSAPGDCKTSICSSWMEGPHAFGPKLPHSPLPSARRLISSSAFNDELTQGGVENLVSQMVTHMMMTHDDAMEIPEKRLLLTATVSATTTQFTNSYSAAGFDAVAIGCGDSPKGIKACTSAGSNDISPSANTSNAGFVATGVIVLLVVIALFGAVTVRHFRRRMRMNQANDFALAHF